jgi:hypothetical protein
LIIAQWSCSVQPEKWEKFLKFAKDTLKPFYESHGCKRYELLTSIDMGTTYFSYQTTLERYSYIEQLLFNSVEDFERFHESTGVDPKSRETVAMYEKEFGVSSCSFMILNETV